MFSSVLCFKPAILLYKLERAAPLPTARLEWAKQQENLHSTLGNNDFWH